MLLGWHNVTNANLSTTTLKALADRRRKGGSAEGHCTVKPRFLALSLAKRIVYQS